MTVREYAAYVADRIYRGDEKKREYYRKITLAVVKISRGYVPISIVFYEYNATLGKRIEGMREVRKYIDENAHNMRLYRKTPKMPDVFFWTFDPKAGKTASKKDIRKIIQTVDKAIDRQIKKLTKRRIRKIMRNLGRRYKDDYHRGTGREEDA